jgi:hypothetical protein
MIHEKKKTRFRCSSWSFLSILEDNNPFKVWVQGHGVVKRGEG